MSFFSLDQTDGPPPAKPERFKLTDGVVAAVTPVTLLHGALRWLLLGASICQAEPTELHVALRFVEGYVAVDSEHSVLRNSTPAADADRARLLTFVNDRLKKPGAAYTWNEFVRGLKWDPAGVEKLSTTWTDGATKLQAWFDARRGDTALGDVQFWATDVVGAQLVDGTTSGLFTGIENDTPLKLSSTDAFDVANSGELVFVVAPPVSTAELDTAVIGDESAALLLPGIQRGLRPFAGKLWWSEDLTAVAEDHLRLYAIDPAESWGPTSFFLSANASQKRLHLTGPVPLKTIRIKAASAAEDVARHLLIASYNLLPTDYFRGLRQTAPGERYGFKPLPDLLAANSYYINFADAGLVPPRFPPVTLSLEAAARSEARLADLGYTQSLGASADAVSVLFTTPEEVATEDKKSRESQPVALKPAAAKRNFLGVNFGRSSGTKYEANAQYKRTQIAGTDTLGVGGGAVENLFQCDFNYTFDYVAFPQLGHRLSLSARADREPETDRQANDEPATEKRDRITAHATLEVLRNLRGNWFNLEANVTALRSRLQNKEGNSAPLDVKFDGTTASVHALYSHEDYAGSLPWTDVDVELGWGQPSDRNAGGDYRWTRWAVIHRRVVFDSLRWESRGRIHVAAGDIPTVEQPSFGGEDSVRGFVRDSARGKLAWSVQNELWIRPTAGFGLPESIATFVRRNLSVALLGDVGGISSPLEHRASLGTGAGIGVRLVRGPLTLRVDWAHTLTHRDDLRSGSSAYFTVEVRPSF